MNKTIFVKGMKILQASYSKNFTEDDLKVWYMQFKNENENLFLEAINRIIKKSRYMPSIADILHEIKIIENPDLLLDAETEFDNVRKAIRKFGSYRTNELMASLNYKTAEAVRRIGLSRICECEQDKIKFIKNEFEEVFNNIQDADYENKLFKNNNYVATISKKLLLENNIE